MSKENSLIMYISMFIISSILLSLCHKCKQQKKLRIILFVGAIIGPSLVLGMRYYVGTDYENYLIIYNQLKIIPIMKTFSYDIEALNILICKIIYLIYDNQYVFMLVYAFLTIGIAYAGILRIDSKNTFLITIIYLCTCFPLATNGMRQSLATSVIFYAYTFLFVSVKKYLLLCLIASLFHTSALIVFPIGVVYYCMKDIKKSNYVIMFIYTMTIIMIFIGLPMASSNIFIRKFLGYFGNNQDFRIGIGVFILNLPVLLFSIIFNSKAKKIDEYYSVYIMLFILNILFSYLGYINIVLNRFAFYFSISQIFLIPKGIEIFKDDGFRKVLEVIVAIIIIVNFTNEYYVKGYCDMFPYKHIEIHNLEKSGK